MSELPRITVIMGIYNCADTLIEALESLESQTYKRFKVVLCDDGSKDNTLEVALKWAETHPNYVVIQNERNIKLAATLNHCLKYADTEYVARMIVMIFLCQHVLRRKLLFWICIQNLLLLVLLWHILMNMAFGAKEKPLSILKIVILGIVLHSVTLLVWLGNQHMI